MPCVPLKKDPLPSGFGAIMEAQKIRETHTHTQRKFSLNLTISEVLAAMEDMEDFELNLKTLEGGVVTVQVTPTNTIHQLKTMLCEKKAEHPNELKILTAEVLVGGALVRSESQTLEAAGLLDAEFEGTVVYSRKTVEAATKMRVSGESFVQVSIPASLVRISAGAFHKCPQVVRVEIPESVTAIAKMAFAGCSSLGSIIIPESVMAIGEAAFDGCSSLVSISIPDSVKTIDYGVFARCRSLVSISIPKSVTAIGDYAFVECSSLASIIIPRSVTSIGRGAFKGCSSLGSISIPKSVTAIGDYAFVECSSLASITIPRSVTSIGRGAF